MACISTQIRPGIAQPIAFGPRISRIEAALRAPCKTTHDRRRQQIDAPKQAAARLTMALWLAHRRFTGVSERESCERESC